MLPPQRQDRTKQLVEALGTVALERLAAELNVSASTVRRDLDALERIGLVKRVHGGVIWVGSDGRALDTKTAEANRPYAFTQRLGAQSAAKQRIARAASGLVSSGQTLLIDGGTTTFFLAEQLAGQSLQIVTNSLPIAEVFASDDRVELIVLGGLMYPRYGVLLGPMAERALDDVHAGTLFFSVAGISGTTLYNQNQLLVQAELKMMRQAQRRVLLVDSSKFGQQALAKLCDLDRVSTIVTDAPPPVELERDIKQAGCELIIADDIS